MQQIALFEMLSAFCLWLLAALCAARPHDNGFISSYTVDAHADAKYMFVFGDSYSQVEFDVDKAAPSPENPIGNPGLPGATTSGGINWVGDLTTKHNRSLLLTYDFAVGGAPVDLDITPSAARTVDLRGQTSRFVSHLTRGRTRRWAGADNSVMLFWFGQNDVVLEYFAPDPRGPEDLFDRVARSFFAQVRRLYCAGGRTFVFLGVAPVTRTPLIELFAPADRARVAELTRQFNDRLLAGAQDFAASHAGVRWLFVDPVVAFDRVLDQPQAYGSVDATCFNLDGTTCLWWNNYHPGIRIHESVAQQVAGKAMLQDFFKLQ